MLKLHVIRDDETGMVCGHPLVKAGISQEYETLHELRRDQQQTHPAMIDGVVQWVSSWTEARLDQNWCKRCVAKVAI